MKSWRKRRGHTRGVLWGHGPNLSLVVQDEDGAYTGVMLWELFSVEQHVLLPPEVAEELFTLFSESVRGVPPTTATAELLDAALYQAVGDGRVVMSEQALTLLGYVDTDTLRLRDDALYRFKGTREHRKSLAISFCAYVVTFGVLHWTVFTASTGVLQLLPLILSLGAVRVTWSLLGRFGYSVAEPTQYAPADLGGSGRITLTRWEPGEVEQLQAAAVTAQMSVEEYIKCSVLGESTQRDAAQKK